MSGDTLKAKLQFAPLFFKFYGPGRHVRQEMTVLEVSDPSKGPNAPVVQSLPLEQLKAIAMQEQQKAAQNQAVARMPPFMKQPFMQNQVIMVAGQLQATPRKPSCASKKSRWTRC